MYAGHEDPDALANHLYQFFGMRGAYHLVDRYGIDTVNAALTQMEGSSELRNPAGFFTWLVRQLAQQLPRENLVREAPAPSGQPSQEVPHQDR